jgi:microcystin-dependent protein
MAQPYVGEIRIFAGNFAPAGWQLCDGTILPISEYETLFNLIGTTYGGDGQSTFGMPDLRGRLSVHQGGGFTLAETGGAEEVTLTVAQIPAHGHTLLATTSFATAATPQGNLPAPASVVNVDAYGTDQPTVNVLPASIGATGGSQPHSNFQPYLCVNFILSLFGIFPSQT